MKNNNKFKDSVFTMLFSEPALLRELYCALEGVTLPPDAPVSINTLQNVLFMGMYNDISFVIDNKLVVLVEHQSTINPNMALRLLMYIGRVYEKIVKGKNIYSGKRIKIPRPEFFVLYNGKEPFPDSEINRLSQAFEKLKSLSLAEKDFPALELVVKVININEGCNKEISDRCKKLAEYSAFVAKARILERKIGDRKEAIKTAIKYCQKHGILKEFLELHATEVLGMLYTEWNLDDALAVRWEEGIEEGRISEKMIIARNLLAMGIPDAQVAEGTGLSLDEIEKL